MLGLKLSHVSWRDAEGQMVWNDMMTSSNGNICRVTDLLCGEFTGDTSLTGDFPSQRPVTRSFDVFFDPRLNQQLNKQWRRWWFETPSHSLWRHCNVNTWGWNKVADILQTIYSNPFSRTKITAFWIKFLTSLFVKPTYKYVIIDSCNCFALNRW